MSKKIAQIPPARVSDQLAPLIIQLRTLWQDNTGIRPELTGGGATTNTYREAKQRKDQDIDYSAWLYSCNSSGGSCQLLTSATNVHVSKWSTTTTWQRRTIGIGSVSTSVPSGRVVKFRLQFHRSDMWLALDAAHPASLILK